MSRPGGHAGRLWFADWGAGEVVTVDLAGHSAVAARLTTFPFSLDWPRTGAC